MSDEIKVTVVQFGDRPTLQMQYRDPYTRRKVTRSAKTSNRRDAERSAAKWEAELREGRYHAPSRITWEAFRERYEAEVLPGLAKTTDEKVSTVFNSIEKHISPYLLRDMTAERISVYQAKLREDGRSETTIKGHTAHLMAALKWAVRIGFLPHAPKVDIPKRAKASKLMKGRPITAEEFDRLLAKVPAVVGDDVAESWQHYLEGLWLSGLRLGESLNLWWDGTEGVRVDMSGRRPMLLIPAEHEKGHRDRVLPIAPEFAEFLAKTPEAERTGRVLRPGAKRIKGRHLSAIRVGRLVCDIGIKAGVKVNTDARTGKVKYASAHDLRRSFGQRWAARVMPQILMELMRHESIETTMRYYVGRNAHTTADALWAAHEQQAASTAPAWASNKAGNTNEKTATTAPAVAAAN